MISACARASLVMIAFAAAVVPGRAVIDQRKNLTIDFSDAQEAKGKATWSAPDRLSLDPSGLGWPGESNSSLDAWILTEPYAIGLSWRPTESASIAVEVEQGSAPIVKQVGSVTSFQAGQLFVRYSPDRVHWSTWQVLNPDLKPPPGGKGAHYSGLIAVPRRERARYQDLLREYFRSDVPWRSDEEAAVKWILAREPRFFAEHLPFIGYVQFLYEDSLSGGQRIRRFVAQISYSLGGVHAPPKDRDVYATRGGAWRFRADQATP